MTVLHWIIFVLLYLGTVISSLRWARIAQREHYIPKSISRFYWRWIRLKSPNLILLFTIIILTIGSLWYERIAFLLIPVLLIFPFGVGYKSRTEEVVYTPRLRRLIIVYIVLVTLISFLFLVNGLGYFGILLCFIFSPYIFDQSLKLMFNYEKRISNFYIESAVSGLQKVKGPIIAITGSYSKTTTKEVLRQLFELDANVFATPDSFNNRLGIAKSINESEMRGIEVAIIEMGTYGQGEIKEICSWVRPHISVITGIGAVHLERMKTLENILDAKSEIIDLAGSVVINGDDQLLIDAARKWVGYKQVVDCSISSEDAAIYVNYTTGIHTIYLLGEEIGKVNAPEVQQLSIALSVGVMYALDQNISSILERLQKLKPVGHRQSLIKGSKGQLIIDNTYNSNPYSVESSLKLLSENTKKGSKAWLITPGMVELGKDQFPLNVSFAESASKYIDGAFIVGLTNRQALKRGFSNRNVDLYFVNTREEAVGMLNSLISSNDVVLFENDLPDHYP